MKTDPETINLMEIILNIKFVRNKDDIKSKLPNNHGPIKIDNQDMYHSEEGASMEPHSSQSLLDFCILITIHNFTIFHQS